MGTEFQTETGVASLEGQTKIFALFEKPKISLIGESSIDEYIGLCPTNRIQETPASKPNKKPNLHLRKTERRWQRRSEVNPFLHLDKTSSWMMLLLPSEEMLEPPQLLLQGRSFSRGNSEAFPNRNLYRLLFARSA